MAYSFMTAISDGTLRVMPITFPYMKVEDINVRQNVTLLKAGKDYDINNNVITFRYNIPNGDRIAVDRMSQKASLRVNFLEGATFSRENMDDVLTQLLYLTQEAIEGSVDRVSPTGVLDVNGNRIINLGDPIDLQDAVPLHLVVDAEKSIYASEAKCKQYRDEALGYKDSAFTSADRAYASETNAKTSEIAAANSANSVKGLEIKAQASADAALVSQNAAKVSEDNAKVSETNSKTSETSALSSKNSATSSATTATNAMNSAKTSETNAKSSETKAKTSETNAKASETAALSSKDAAKISETNAATSATAAKNSETSATSSKNTAKEHADATQAIYNKLLPELQVAGSVPVGTIAMVAHNSATPPVGWLFCGTTFDTATYPALAKLFPDGRIPDFTNRFPRGAGATAVGAHGAESIPSHTHGVSVSGNVSTLAAATYNTTSNGSYSGTTSSAGAHTHTYTGYSKSVTLGGVSIATVEYGSTNKTTSSSGNHTHTYSVPNHTHSTTVPAHNHSFSWSGNTSSYGSGSSVLPLNIGVKYIIKAYEGVNEKDEALVIVGRYDARVTALENKKYTAKDVGAVDSSNVVGKLSEGALFEAYQKDGWVIIKRIDGTMEMYIRLERKDITVSSDGSFTYWSANIKYPELFYQQITPSLSLHLYTNSGGVSFRPTLSTCASYTDIIYGIVGHVPTAQAGVRATIGVSIGAKGFWKNPLSASTLEEPVGDLDAPPSIGWEPEDTPQVLPYDPEI